MPRFFRKKRGFSPPRPLVSRRPFYQDLPPRANARGSSPAPGPRNYKQRLEQRLEQREALDDRDRDREQRAYERSERVREQREKEQERDRDRDRGRDWDRGREYERGGGQSEAGGSNKGKGKERQDSERDLSPPSPLDVLHASSTQARASKLAAATSASALGSDDLTMMYGPAPPLPPPPDQPPAPPGVFKPIGFAAGEQPLAAATLEIPPKPTKRTPKNLTEEERADLRQRWSTHLGYVQYIPTRSSAFFRLIALPCFRYLAELTSAHTTTTRIRKEITDLTALQSAPYYAQSISASEKRHIATKIAQHKARLIELKARCEMLSNKADANLWPERPSDLQKFVDKLEEQASKVVDGLSELRVSIEGRNTRTGLGGPNVVSGGDDAMEIDTDDDTIKPTQANTNTNNNADQRTSRDLDIEELCLQLQNVENGIFQTQQDVESFREDVLEQVREHISAHVNTGVPEDALVEVRKQIEAIEGDANGFAEEIMGLWGRDGEMKGVVAGLVEREGGLRAEITGVSSSFPTLIL